MIKVLQCFAYHAARKYKTASNTNIPMTACMLNESSADNGELKAEN